MRDAIELEWAGIPSVAVVHTALCGGADAIKRISGHPEYPYVTVDYPYVPMAAWTPEEVREIAKGIAPKVRALLTGEKAT